MIFGDTTHLRRRSSPSTSGTDRESPKGGCVTPTADGGDPEEMPARSTYSTMSDEKKEPMLDHQSGINKDGEPFIQLILNKNGKSEVISQMSPQQCRDHAMAMFEVAEAAEQDAFLVWFIREKLGGDMKMAGATLHEFRHWRELRAGIETGMKVIPKEHIKG